MDIVRETSNSSGKKLWIFAAVALCLLCAVVATALGRTVESSIDRDLLRIATVKNGPLKVHVRASGSLVSTDVRWLASEVGGRVESVVVLPGAVVNRGDIIVELSNPALVQRQEELQWDLEAVEANQNAQALNNESRRLDQKLAELNAKNQFETTEMNYKAQLALRERNLGSISEIEFEKIRLETGQRKEHWLIEQQRTENLIKNLEAQEAARKAEVSKLGKQLERLDQQLADLSIRAPTEAVVQDVAVEPGQNIAAGINIAKLVQQKALIARLQVPEYQVHSVVIGQQVMIDTRKSRVPGSVQRVSPSVIEGTVEVDVVFTGDMPIEARPDLTIDAEIQVAAIEETLYVERPVFSQSHQTMRIFKVLDNDDQAEKTLVEFGVSSVRTIEIKSGLSVGDKIIVSDQSDYDEFSLLAIH